MSKILIIAIIIIILVIGGIYFSQRKTPGENNPNIEVNINPNLLSIDEILSQFEQIEDPDCSNYYSGDACYTDYAEEQGNPRPCGKLMDSYWVLSCITGVAVKTGNSDVCKLTPAYPEVCIANIEKNSGKCATTGEGAPNRERVIAQCYTMLAVNDNNIDICNEIKKESYRDTCYINYVNEFKDLSQCGKIEDWMNKQQCLELIDNPLYKN